MNGLERLKQHSGIEVYDNVDDWLAARQPIVGASESPGILGHGYANESQYSTWARKLGKLPPLEDSETMECGRILQPSIIELFRRRFIRECPTRAPKDFQVNTLGEFTICRSLDHPFLGCTLDGLFEMEMEDGWALVEAKNVSLFMGREWKAEEDFHDEEEDFDWDVTEERRPRVALPLRVQIQCQHQLATNPKFVRNFAVGLIGGNKLVWVEVLRDQEFIDQLIPVIEEFHEMVVTRRAPPIDGSMATRRALAFMHPNDNGRAIVLPPASKEWHEQLQRAKLEEKQARARKTLYSNLLRGAIGDATFGLLPDGSQYTLKTQQREEKVRIQKASQFRVLRHAK